MHIEKLIVNREVTHENGDVSHSTVNILTETEEGMFRVYNPFTDIYEYFDNIAATKIRYNTLHTNIESYNAQLEEVDTSFNELKTILENRNKNVGSVISIVNSTGN
jgi:iron uptake system EfeUOB component EfeO/EfeM